MTIFSTKNLTFAPSKNFIMKNIKTLCVVIFLTILCACEGPEGPAGHDGNANVQSSTLETHAKDWSWNQQGSYWQLDIEWDAINFNIVDYGAVLVYMDFKGEGGYEWHQLPLTFHNQDQEGNFYSTSIEPCYYDYGLTLFWTDSDFFHGPNPCDLYDSGTLTFKIVAIDATCYAKYRYENLSDYNTVKLLFNLED